MNSGELSDSQTIDSTYLLEVSLGSGGMGSVFRARHIHLGKSFALKLINQATLSSTDSLRRFEVEAKALGRLSHPNIVRVTDYGVDAASGGSPYLVMEYLEGESLRDHMAREGPLSPDVALPILNAIADGLDFAHAQGILHRDLKPHNVILSEELTGRRGVKIVDFGLARFVAAAAQPTAARNERPETLRSPVLENGDPSGDHADTMELASPLSQSQQPLRQVRGASSSEGSATVTPPESPVPSGHTEAGTVVGTAGYMAPEIADREEATAASDIYSFGVLAFEMLVGQRPFDGGFMAVMRAHVYDSPPVPSEANSGLARELDEALLKPLVKKAGDRPATAHEVVRRLQEAWGRATERQWKARELPRRVAVSVGLAAAAAALILVAGTWSVIDDLECRLFDLRILYSRPRAPSPMLALALLDDATLEADPDRTPLPGYDEEVAAVLREVLDAGALGVGIDIVGPGLWSESEAFVDLVLESHDRVALAAHWDRDAARYVGTEVVEGAITVVLQPERAAGLFGLANLRQDRDGAVRTAIAGLWDEAGIWRPGFAAKAVSIIVGGEPPGLGSREPVWIDYRIDWQQLPRWSWKDLGQVVVDRPDELAGRFLVVGGDIEGYGDTGFPLPYTGDRPDHGPGVVVQALVINTLLDGAPIRGPVWGIPILASALLAPLIALVLWMRRMACAVGLLVGFMVGYLGAAFLLFRVGSWVVPMAGPIVVFPVVGSVAVALRWRLPTRPARSADTWMEPVRRADAVEVGSASAEQGRRSSS